jgi:hypothetical protein
MLFNLNIKILDIVLEDNMEGQLPTSRIGCFVQYAGSFLDVLMIQEGAHTIKPDNIKFKLDDDPNDQDPKVVLIIKDIQNDEPYVGSVSIARSNFLDGQINQPHKMWITLFDDQGDDEYDGAMGLNDDEDPRVLMEFIISPVVVPPPAIPETSPQRKSQRTLAPTASSPIKKSSYLDPIGNLKEQKRNPPAPVQ